MSSWRDRESETQVRSRVANESLARAKAGAPAGRVGSFRCECGDQDCSCAILLTLSEYEAVRAVDTHFAIAHNHENPEREGLIEEHEHFTVVETVSGEAVKRARRTGRGSEIGGFTGPGSEGPPRLRYVHGSGGSSARLERLAPPAEHSRPASAPAEGIELLNVHWHEVPGAHEPYRCPVCDAAISNGDDAVHHGGELYHPACARQREKPA
jgi:hypothetical protein